MKNIFFIIVACCFTSLVNAQQKIICLHPILGDTIDLTEKNTYLLFPEIDSNGFQSGQVKMNGDQYYFEYTLNDKMNNDKVSIEKLKEYHTNVEKLLAYHLYMKNSKAKKSESIVTRDAQEELQMHFNAKYDDVSFRRKLKKDAMRYQELKKQAELKGYSGVDKENYIKTSGVLIFDVSKKKNKE
ncbi:hypothetical protein [Marinifilum fragile]|uniref:hypothetical protein n=1 Tax=Marinifilum fragile TaxID=570161 RepID=UPI002AABB235|nr:hypothetical protein [Marinifilum fragile]